MCSYADRPYTTGTANYNIFLQTPIRDKVACPSGSAESYVIPIANGSAYLDLSALSLQLIILAILLVGSPVLYLRKIFSQTLYVLLLCLGMLYGLILILASLNHMGSEVVVFIFGASIIAFAAVGLYISQLLKQ